MAHDDGLNANGKNHPLALRMAIIAFLTNNITIGALWGSFSVLLTAVEGRLGVNREMSSLSIPAVTLVMAMSAPFVGALAGRYSLKVLMIVGAILSALGFLLLAATASYPLYILAYAAFLGPGMAIGVILPATLVTQWFQVGRGRALGIVSTPVVIALVPLASTWTLETFGLASTYLLLALLSLIAAIANFFIRESPPEIITPRAEPDTNSISIASLLRLPRFWALSIAAVASTTSSIVLSTNMVPMAASWGFSAPLAAILLSVQSLVGIVGTIFFGWVADRLGAVVALVIILINGAALWSLLLLHPPFVGLLVLVGLIGMHGAGVLPIFGLVLSQTFGRENFSRAYGVSNLLNLPFSVLCVPIAAIAYTRAGSYSAPIVGQVIFFAVAVVLALSARPSKGAMMAS